MTYLSQPLVCNPASLDGLSTKLITSHHDNNYGGAVKRLNAIRADHAHLMAGTLPILALDMYEHSYHMDYGANAEAYVDAFMRNIDWAKASARYALAVAQATHQLSVPSAEVLADKDRFHVIDVRRAGAYQSATDCLPGATWRDPEKVAQWSGALPPGKPVLVYCVYGHEVSQSTAASLRAKGIDARFLVGGIHDWKAAGLPLQSKEAGRV